MRRPIQIRLNPLHVSVPVPLRFAASLALLAASFVAAKLVLAQVPPAHTSAASQTGKPAKRIRSRTAEASAPQPIPAVNAIPPPPAWPVNEPPKPPHVIWDSHGLKIEASNSSLNQILHEVSTDTGAKVEGFSKDQRIFGTYGPGPAREVLSHLLDGSGYNVLMIGGAGDAPPSRIVLSATGPTGPSSTQPPTSAQNQNQSADEENEAEEPQPEEQPAPEPPPPPQETPQPTPIRNPFGGMPRVPMPPMNQPNMPPDQPQNNPQ